MRPFVPATVLLLVAGAFAPLQALADTPQVAITIKGQGFVPRQVQVPSGKKIKLMVHNDDAMPAEFESVQLHREQVVIGGQQISVYVGPLDPGRYEFFNDFHPSSRGYLIVK